ncbi:MAG TPA: signal peptidase I [Nocardioidaceae bacterium]|nr:signal peptidase I [Nocardioidaceae bacterium]
MTAGTTTRPRSRAATRRRWAWWQEIALLVVLAVAISVLLKTFVVQMFFVPSASMRPLFVHDDHILVQKISYETGQVHRGDVVVFDDPGGRWLSAEGTRTLPPFPRILASLGLYPTNDHLVKRVIGVGGDHVKCCDTNGRITVNGVPLHEKGYIVNGAQPSSQPFDVVVPTGRLWVMGDNRPDSADSRYHEELPGSGTVPVRDVVGKVWAIVWPLDRAHLLHRPGTFEQAALQASR